LGRGLLQGHAKERQHQRDDGYYSFDGSFRYAAIDPFPGQLADDHLGRLKQIDELNDDGSLYASTLYAYDARGNLTQVDQGSQQRLFTYDSLSRLKTAKNPEQEMLRRPMTTTTLRT
jgi:YD repeat-containing protein